MAIKIRSVRKCVDNNGIKILVHGPAGSGKTFLCATTGEPTLIISNERGLLSVRDAPAYVKAVEVKTLVELDEVYDWLNSEAIEAGEGGDLPFSWIALDSITELAETVLSYEKANNKDPRAAYGNLQDHVGVLLRKFRDMPRYNVIMTCKQERANVDGVNIYTPMMPGSKLGQQIPYLFDEVFALRVEEDEKKEKFRIIQTVRDVKYDAKDRSGVLDTFEKPNLKKIAKKIRSGIETVGSTKIVEEVEEAVVEVDVVEDEAENVAKEKVFGYDHDVQEFFIIEKGEVIPSDERFEWITEEQYVKGTQVVNEKPKTTKLVKGKAKDE